MKLIREYVHPILVGGIPMLIGCIAIAPMMIYWIFAKAIPLLMPIPSLVFLYAWARLGYQCRDNGWGVKSVILAQLIPVVACAISLYQNMLPLDVQNDILLGMGFAAVFPALNLAVTLTMFHFNLAFIMILSLVLMIGVFLGGVAAADIHARKEAEACVNESEKIQ